MESIHRHSTNNARSQQPSCKCYKVRGAWLPEHLQFNAGERDQLADTLDLVDIPSQREAKAWPKVQWEAELQAHVMDRLAHG